MVRKAKRAGIEVREASYNDAFVQGMTDIFTNTRPSGTEFWLMERISKRLAAILPIFFREELIGAYYGDELVGFAMWQRWEYGVLGQIISKIKHRDKAINNALIAKVMRNARHQQLRYLSLRLLNEILCLTSSGIVALSASNSPIFLCR